MEVIKRHPIHYELYEYDNKYYYGNKCEHLQYVEFTFNDININVSTTKLIFKYSDYLNITSFEKIYSFTLFEYNSYLFSLDFDLPLHDFITKLEWYAYIIFQYPDIIISPLIYYLFKHINNLNINMSTFDKILTLLPEQLHYYVTHYYFTFYILKLNINHNIIDFYLQHNINLFSAIEINKINKLIIHPSISIDRIIYNISEFDIPNVYYLTILEKINEYNLTSFMEYLKYNISDHIPLIISTIIFKNFNLFKILVNETNVNIYLDNHYTSILYLMAYIDENQCNQYKEWINYIVNTLNADCTLCDDKYKSILQLACEFDRIYMLKLLLSKLDMDINYYDKYAINSDVYIVKSNEAYNLLDKYGICNINSEINGIIKGKRYFNNLNNIPDVITGNWFVNI